MKTKLFPHYWPLLWGESTCNEILYFFVVSLDKFLNSDRVAGDLKTITPTDVTVIEGVVISNLVSVECIWGWKQANTEYEHFNIVAQWRHMAT